jgi:hypothetical protein
MAYWNGAVHPRWIPILLVEGLHLSYSHSSVFSRSSVGIPDRSFQVSRREKGSASTPTNPSGHACKV